MNTIDHEQRAGLLWPVLTTAAKERGELTYSQAAAAIGIHYRATARALGPIQRYCLDQGLPRLTGLVYASSTGLPGGGFAGEPGNQRDLEEVWGFDWASLQNPFSTLHNAELDKIAEEVLDDPALGSLKYSMRLTRGDQQRVFRRSVMKAYDGKCAICEATFVELIEAAHIIPFGDPRAELRVNPRNGIALCRNHHALFDSGWLSVSKRYKIAFDDPETESGDYTEEDEGVAVRFHGSKLCLPEDERLWPDPLLLQERNQL